MFLYGHELQILRDLIGKKAEAVIIPGQAQTISDPVSMILWMGSNEGIQVDSCFRKKKPTEIPENYPQIRIRVIHSLPPYMHNQRIAFGNDGEIIRRVQIVNEVLPKEHGQVEYSRSIHIDLTGGRHACVIRDSYATPNLKLCMDDSWKDQLGPAEGSRQITTLG